MDWFPHYIDTYDADTLELTLEQDAIYHRLLRWYYKHERPLPASETALASICRIGVDKWQEVAPSVTRYFRVSHNEQKKTKELSHDKCNEVIVAQTQRRRDAKERQLKHRKNNVISANVTRDERVSHAAIGEDRIGEESKKVRKRDAPLKKRLTLDWEPSQDDYNYAKAKGFTGDRFNNEVAAFIRYFTGPDAKNPARADWGRSWKAWIDRSHQRGGASRGRQSPTSVTAAAFELISEMEERERNGSARDGGSGGVENWAGLGDPVVQANGTGSDSEAFVGVTIENGEQGN